MTSCLEGGAQKLLYRARKSMTSGGLSILSRAHDNHPLEVGLFLYYVVVRRATSRVGLVTLEDLSLTQRSTASFPRLVDIS